MCNPIALLFLCTLVVGCATGARQAVLEEPAGRFDAPAGRFHKEWDDELSAELAFTATIRLISGKFGSGWVPGAAVGISAGPPELDDSLQVMLIHNRPADPRAEVKYRLFRAGQLLQEGPLLDVGLSEPVQVHLRFDRGKVLITINDGSALELNTHMKAASRYASVWSGSAEIKFAP